jgi:Mg-chelatase subunit ChlI
LIGTMNPEEGDLRPQLLDRFAFSVDIGSIREARQRVQIMERNLKFELDSEAFAREWAPKEQELAEQILAARQLVDSVAYTSRDLVSIASLTASLQVDGHRADLVILKAARAQAAFDARRAVTPLDIAIAAELALPHRIKHGPFHQSEITVTELQEKINEMQQSGEADGEGETQDEPADSQKDPVKKKS